MTHNDRPIRVMQVIARLNIGGPAIHALALSSRLTDAGFDVSLVRGREGPREGNMDPLAQQLGVQPILVPSMRRELGLQDVRTVWEMRKLMRSLRPDVVHTHAAKAGTTARLAILTLPPSQRPRVRIHTFHGHVLTGYFSRRKAMLFRRIERYLARHTTLLVAVSEEVAADLMKLGVARRTPVAVVPLGFDLRGFAFPHEERQRVRASVREELDLPMEDPVVTLVARLVPIKRVDRFLRMAAAVHARIPTTRFLVVGDGELADELRTLARDLGERVVWAGYRQDMAGVYAASDVVVLTSDNEGTPVSLIEASAAGVPVVSTEVGGVASVIRDGETGYVVDHDDEGKLCEVVAELLIDPDRARALGARGAEHVASQFSLDRLVGDVIHLYRSLLATNPPNRASDAV